MTPTPSPIRTCQTHGLRYDESNGGAFPGGFGRRRVRGWFSTGSQDPLRPPNMVTRAYQAARGPGAPIEMHVFAGGHDLGDQERRALVTWWLGT